MRRSHSLCEAAPTVGETSAADHGDGVGHGGGSSSAAVVRAYLTRWLARTEPPDTWNSLGWFQLVTTWVQRVRDCGGLIVGMTMPRRGSQEVQMPPGTSARWLLAVPRAELTPPAAHGDNAGDHADSAPTVEAGAKHWVRPLGSPIAHALRVSGPDSV